MTAWRLAPFTAEITPPVGEGLAFGLNQKTDTPIFARGVVLDDGRTRAVLAAAEIIGLYGAVYGQWRAVIARAAGVPVRNVLLHCVHQHDSLMPPSRYCSRGLAEVGLVSPSNPAFYERILERIEKEVKRAVRGGFAKVERLATAERRVSGLAANRRLVGPDGKVAAMRWSMTTKPELQRWPVGRIDPLLRTIGFFGARNRLLASLHFYATHPMAAYGREMVSSDVPGVALARLRKNFGGAQHIYFTGCAGDITFGKYTVADKRENLRVLGGRLGEALIAGVRALEPRAPGQLAFARERLTVPLDRARINATALRARLRKTKTPSEAHFPLHALEILANPKLATVELTRLDIGSGVHVLSLPAETVVEYQLYAQALVPDRFLAVAAYGDGTLGYLPTAAMFKEGGYESVASPSTPALEQAYKRALDHVLHDLRV